MKDFSLIDLIQDIKKDKTSKYEYEDIKSGALSVQYYLEGEEKERYKARLNLLLNQESKCIPNYNLSIFKTTIDCSYQIIKEELMNLIKEYTNDWEYYSVWGLNYIMEEFENHRGEQLCEIAECLDTVLNRRRLYLFLTFVRMDSQNRKLNYLLTNKEKAHLNSRYKKLLNDFNVKQVDKVDLFSKHGRIQDKSIIDLTFYSLLSLVLLYFNHNKELVISLILVFCTPIYDENSVYSILNDATKCIDNHIKAGDIKPIKESESIILERVSDDSFDRPVNVF